MRPAISDSRSVSSSAPERLEGIADRQVHVFGNRPSLHPDGQAFRPQPLAAAHRAGAQRPVRVQFLLLGPRAFLEPAPQVRHHPFEVPAERVRRASPLPPCRRASAPPPRAAARAEQDQVADLARQARERRRRIEIEGPAQAQDRFAHQLRVSPRPRRDCPVQHRLRFVGHDPPRIEVVSRAEPLAFRAGAVRRVEREGARRHLGHADPALDARQAPREQPVAPVQRVDDDDVVGQAESSLDRFTEPALDPGPDQQAVHDDVDRMIAAPVQDDVLVQRADLAVDAHLGEPARVQGRQLLPELPLAAAHDGGEHVDPLVVRVEQHHVRDPVERLRRNLAAADVAVRHADVGEQQAEVVVDLGDGADRRPRVRGRRLLFDRNRGGQPLDQVDVRLFHLLEELPGVGGQRLDVAPLSLGVDRVEGQRRLARPREAGDDDKFVPRDIDVDILQVVNARAPNRNPVASHEIQPPPGHARPGAEQSRRAELQEPGATEVAPYVPYEYVGYVGPNFSSAAWPPLERSRSPLQLFARGPKQSILALIGRGDPAPTKLGRSWG